MEKIRLAMEIEIGKITLKIKMKAYVF